MRVHLLCLVSLGVLSQVARCLVVLAVERRHKLGESTSAGSRRAKATSVCLRKHPSCSDVVRDGPAPIYIGGNVRATHPQSLYSVKFPLQWPSCGLWLRTTFVFTTPPRGSLQRTHALSPSRRGIGGVDSFTRSSLKVRGFDAEARQLKRMAPSVRTDGIVPRRMQRIVIWFRNDLRLHDNAILDKARRCVRSGEVREVLPLYCFDPRAFQTSEYGSRKMEKHRAKFLLESVTDLRSRLRSIGSDLLVATQRPEDVVPQLISDDGGLVLAQSEVTSEETDVEERVRKALLQKSGNAKMELLWGPTMYHRDDLPLRSNLSDMPDVFTPFRNKVEKRCDVRKQLEDPGPGSLPLGAAKDIPLVQEMLACSPTLADLIPGHTNDDFADSRSTLNFVGGETAALERLKYYLWDSDLLATYFETRNGMVGGDYSTKFSPWLAHGCLSPRRVYHEIRKYETLRTSNKSTYWVIFELIWRDFFRFFCEKHGDKVFYPGGTIGRRPNWSNDMGALKRWKEGTTGVPLIDANMREMAATGFMSNRGRQNVASFLALDLNLDWRLGADHFESLLLDYDVCSNWGNWVSAAGLTGGRVNRFNIVKQSKDYDKEGSYVRMWVPELSKVPTKYVHTPWLMPTAVQESSECVLGQDYPYPLKKQDAWQNYGGGKSGGNDRKKKKPYKGYYKPMDEHFAPQQRKGGKRGKGNARSSDFEMYGGGGN